jgi:hypothetical protein
MPTTVDHHLYTSPASNPHLTSNSHQLRGKKHPCPKRRNTILLACTRITARITRAQSNLLVEESSGMASHNKTPQVSSKPPSYITILTFSYDDSTTNLISCKINQKECFATLISSHTVISKNQLSSKINQSETNTTAMGTTLRYEIVSEILKPQPNSNVQKTQSTLIPGSNTFLQSQDQDHDMADSSSPSRTKRSQVIIHPNNQQKKTRCDLHSDHAKYANQNLWLGFQTMELLAKDTETLPTEINISIRELIRIGFRESEAVELHTTKIS